MVDVIVFVGPTLSRAEVRAAFAGAEGVRCAHAPTVEVRPPAGRGDLIRACLLRPRIIGLVDGHFDRVPSVWHKEILWALHEGIEVFGAASMGALRAAELAPFGMEGVGRIYEGYRDGVIEDDDEVAVAHATAEEGHRPMSEAMVDVRATLAAAAANGLLTPAEADAIERAAKELFYADRTYPAIFEAAARLPLRVEGLEALRRFLPEGRVSLKRDDARALLATIRLRLEGGRAAGPRPGFSFARTDAWRALRAEIDNERSPAAEAGGAGRDPIVDELLVAGCYGRALEAALARALCAREAERAGAVQDGAVVQACAEAFRRERGLLAADALERWLAAQRLQGSEVDAFFGREALLRRARAISAGAVAGHLRDQLAAMGLYGPLSRRAEEKARALTTAGLADAGVAETGLTEAELWQWHCQETLGGAAPESLEAYAAVESVAPADLLTAIARERCFRARTGAGSKGRERERTS